INTNNQNRILIKAGDGFANGSFIFLNETNPVYGTVEMWSKAYTVGDCECPNDKYVWQFFGPPVHNYTLSNYDPYLYQSAIRRYDEAKQTTVEGKQWIQLVHNSVLEKFKGYEIVNRPDPKKIIFEGQLVNDNLNTGELPVTDGSYYKGWHLLSNPYTAAISVKDMVFGSGMEATVYIYTTGSFNDWRNNAGNHGTVSIWNDDDVVMPGQYLAIPKNIAGFTPTTAVIPSMQGFMVGVIDHNTPPASGKTVSFNYSNLVKNTQQQRVRSFIPENSEYVCSVVTLSGNNQYDRVWLFTDEQCTPSYDNGWDGRKFLNDSILQLYATQSEGNFQIHATDNINETYLAIRATNEEEFCMLHFRHTNIETKYAQLLLYDIQTNTITDITADGSSYGFRASPGDITKRFKILTMPVESENNEQEIFPAYVRSQRIYVNNYSTENGVVRLYNLSGSLLSSLQLNTENIAVFPKYDKGVYLIQVETDKRKVTQKVIIN
ncbi:MAG: T9SS type A sorting domain-containing protein, partial [Paludibacter sp.]|nr:T9SS type A sorting domain-containing protein [Paludibacter sp.]